MMVKKPLPLLRIVQAINFTILMVCAINDSFAQDGKTNRAHVGIVYPLSTNGSTARLDTNNFSLHLISGVSRQENHCLIAGISGLVIGDAYGCMVSGILNQIVGYARGVQIAGLINKTGHSQGAQVAGLVNKSGNAAIQVAGLINMARQVSGVQIAGLINIAERSDYPIGLLNIIKEGEQQLGASVDETGGAALTLRSGGKVLYGVIGPGYNFKYDEARYMLQAGFGAHLLSSRLMRLNAEVISTAMTNFEEGVYNKNHVGMLAGIRIARGVELFAGPTFNHLLFKVDQTDIRGGRYLWSWRGDDMHNGFFLGGMAGLQFSL